MVYKKKMMTYRNRKFRDSKTIDGIIDNLLFRKDNFVDEDGEIDNDELDYEIDEMLENIYKDIDIFVDNELLVDLFEEYFGINKDSIRDIPALAYQDIRDGVLRKLKE